jgi:methylenetetrahydrofolate dehydrogenase (NADP+)/methenyltetrahydrofolate cyclohydrolase
MILLDGKQIADKLNLKLKDKIENGRYEIQFALFLVGKNPASESYVNNKLKSAELVGIKPKLIALNDDISEQELIKKIEIENANENIAGIIVQLPLPKHIDAQKVMSSITPSKDVDGLGIINQGRLICGEKGPRPATPTGVITLLNEYGIEIIKKRVVIVGRSNLVGKPLALMFLEQNATVTIAHSKTANLKAVCKDADILVIAIGKPKFINDEYIKKDAVVIDVGINRIEGKLVGDVDFDSVSQTASYLTPVPKGVGPMTVYCLLNNIYEAFLKHSR